MAQFNSYWYTNYYIPNQSVEGCVCSGTEDTTKSWEISTVNHTYKFHSDNYGMRLDQINVQGHIGQITGFPPGLYGDVSISFTNRGKTISKNWLVYPTTSFTLEFPLIIKEYYRIIESGTEFTISFSGSDYYYKSSTGQYAGLKNYRNGIEDHLWTTDVWPLSGGVHVTSRTDSKPADWVYRMELLINPDPPPPSSPLQYLDGPLGATWKWGVVDGLWPGLIREWIED